MPCVLSANYLVASNRETVTAFFWDDANSNGLRDAEECYARQTLTIKGHDNVLTNTLSFGMFDRDSDGILDYWELLHADAGLSPTNAADALLDSDGDGLINYHEYWANCNPAVPDGSNTLLSVCSRSVDDRIRDIVPSNAVDRFVNFFENGSNGIFIANTNFWLRDVDVSCVSVWHTGGSPGSKAATAVTRRHVIMSAHWFATDYVFYTTNGTFVSRHLIDSHQIRNTDILIGRLDCDLPDSIQIPNVLDAKLVSLIADCQYLPGVCLNQQKAATVLELDSLNCHAYSSTDGYTYQQLGMTSAINVISQSRAEIRSVTDVGNSGCPVFLLWRNELIFLFSKHLGNSSSRTWGPLISYRINEVQQEINEWEGDHADEYQINVLYAEEILNGL